LRPSSSSNSESSFLRFGPASTSMAVSIDSPF
jgi:hypothetical protein